MTNGERIKQVREMRRFTQTALIEELKLPSLKQSQLSRIESDLADADAETIELLAIALGVRSDFFDRPIISDLVPQSPQLRARSRLTQSSKTAVVRWCQTLLEEYLRLEQRASRIQPNVRDLRGWDPAEAAKEIRRDLGFDDSSPLPYIILAIERLGVTVLGLPYREEHIDALCAWHGSRPIIGVLSGVPADRLRFSVAHELGHLVLHRGEGKRATLESEADIFAAELLTPIESMRNCIPQKPKLSQLTLIKSQWGISIKSLIRRARELDYIDQDRAISLYKQMSARGWSKKEPGFVPFEKPRAFRKLAEISFGDGPNIERFARSAAWSDEMVRDVLDRHARVDELPHESSPRQAVNDNVVDISAIRRQQRARTSEAGRIQL
jgi:Zn-dependent peptidase ImmA (M78 family)